MMRALFGILAGFAALTGIVPEADAQADGFAEMTFDGFELTAPDGWRIAPQDEHLPMVVLFPEGSGDRPDRVAVVGIERLDSDPDSLAAAVAGSAAIFDAVLVSMRPIVLAHGDGLAGVFESETGQVGVVAFRRFGVVGSFLTRDLDIVVMVYETGILNDETFVPTKTADELVAEATHIADGFSVDG